MKIEKLPEKQIARFLEFVEKWTRLGLSTEPAAREKAEKAIIAAYLAAGLNPPKRIVWCGSPLSQGLTRAVILRISPVRDSVGDSAYGSHDAGWVSFYDYFRTVCKLKDETEKLSR
jgi:hypothetical protein